MEEELEPYNPGDMLLCNLKIDVWLKVSKQGSKQESE